MTSQKHSDLYYHRSGERGSIMIMTAVLMVGLVMAVGLTIDVSRLYMARAELQNAADAAALAGARELNSGTTGIQAAYNRATGIVNTYGLNDVAVTMANVEYAKNLGGPYTSKSSYDGMTSAQQQAFATNVRFVRVTTQPGTVTTLFSGRVLGNTLSHTAAATAGMSVGLNVFTGFAPVFVYEDAINPLTAGNVYTIRLPPGNSYSPGNYGLLDPDGSDVRNGLAGGASTTAQAGDTIPTKTGVNAGTVRQGLNTRFDDYTGGTSPTTYPPDTNIKSGITFDQYQNGSPTQAPSHTGVTDRRIIIVPITRSVPGNGHDEIVVNRFAALFLRSPVAGGNGGDIDAEYISDRVTVGGGGYTPGGGTSSITIPVLYK